MQTRKGNVAGATSGASSGPPTSPPLLCCCCCCCCAAVCSCATLITAAVLLLLLLLLLQLCCCGRATLMCLCLVLEVGNLHVAFFAFFDRPDKSFFQAALWGLVMQTKKVNVASATSGASSGPPTSPPLLFCCCCAAVVVLRSSCVSASYPQVVQFHLGVGSCACILPLNLQFYCCVVPPVVAHLKNASLGISRCIAQTKLKGKRVPPPSPLLLIYAIAAALLLVLCYAAVVLLSSFGFSLCSDCADSTQYLWYQL